MREDTAIRADYDVYDKDAHAAGLSLQYTMGGDKTSFSSAVEKPKSLSVDTEIASNLAY